MCPRCRSFLLSTGEYNREKMIFITTRFLPLWVVVIRPRTGWVQEERRPRSKLKWKCTTVSSPIFETSWKEIESDNSFPLCSWIMSWFRSKAQVKAPDMANEKVCIHSFVHWLPFLSATWIDEHPIKNRSTRMPDRRYLGWLVRRH